MFGRLVGVLLLVLGGLFTAAAASMFDSVGAAPRLLVGGPFLIGAGLAMIVAPGHPIRLAELDAATGPRWLRASPLGHKVAWIASAGVAGAIGMVSMSVV